MVLIGKNTATGATCLLFKIMDARDKNNVFMMCPLHSINPDTHRIKIQVLGDPNTQISGTIYVTAALFPVQNTFLDCALGVIENPEVINNSNNLRDLSYLTFDVDIYMAILNKKGQIYFANKTGIVNSIETKIKDINYTVGSSENISIINNLPTPGGYILTEEEAVEGMSGSILVVDKNIIGMIIASSSIKDNEETKVNKKSFSLAVDMYYLIPHILQCVNSIDKYTSNNPQNLASLCKYTTMKTFIDDLQPVVLHLGGNYIFNQLGGMNLEKDITLLNIHNYLDVNSLFLLQENIGNSISVKTTLNSNNEFLDYFFDKQESSVVMIKSANYYDRVVNKRVDIDFVKDPLYANILDWVFRGDPKEHVILNVQTKTLNNNGSVTLSEIKQFKFNSSPVVDTINGQSSARTNLQIPAVFFDKNNGLMTLNNNFNMRDVGGNPIRIQFLSIWDDIGNVFSSVGNTITQGAEKIVNAVVPTGTSIAPGNEVYSVAQAAALIAAKYSNKKNRTKIQIALNKIQTETRFIGGIVEPSIIGAVNQM